MSYPGEIEDDYLPGDELILEPDSMMERRASLPAPPEQVWPWLVQLGRGRAGWYLSRRLEWLTPRRKRALRVIAPEFQQVAVGDRVADHGREGWFEARVVDPPRALVWGSERGSDLSLTWAFVLEPDSSNGSELRIRLRFAHLAAATAPVLVERGTELFDRLSISMMLAGLHERLADAGRAHADAGQREAD